MDMDEFETVTAATIEVCRESGAPVQIGCTSTYTAGAVRRARFAQRLGADAIQVALPFWFPLSDDQVIAYFGALADACPDMSIVIYDRADRTNLSFDGELCTRLAERVPIIGIKVETSVGDGPRKVRDQGYIAHHRLTGMVTSFLGPEYHRVRDPYPSTSPEHVRELRAWMVKPHTPTLLRLD